MLESTPFLSETDITNQTFYTMKNLYALLMALLLVAVACKDHKTEEAPEHRHDQETALPVTHETHRKYTHTGLPKVDVLYEGYVMPVEGKTFLPGAEPDGARKVGSTISLVRAKDMVLVADPGMTAAGKWETVVSKMKELGIRPEEVTHVFISHHHPDHTTRLGVFPNATVVDFWATYKDNLWSDHPDNYELTEGVTVIKTPGHTDEDASLLVNTENGVYLLTHLWWDNNYGPETDPLAERPELLKENRNKLIASADWIVPGHGKMFKNTRKQEGKK